MREKIENKAYFGLLEFSSLVRKISETFVTYFCFILIFRAIDEDSSNSKYALFTIFYANENLL